MDPLSRQQRLAQVGILVAVGALVFGVIGVMVIWMGAAPSTAAILLIPGALLLIGSAYTVLRAARSNPEGWQESYYKVSRVLKWLGIVAVLAAIGAAIVTGVHGTETSALQLVLITAVALQGPIGLLIVSRQLRR